MGWHGTTVGVGGQAVESNASPRPGRPGRQFADRGLHARSADEAGRFPEAESVATARPGHARPATVDGDPSRTGTRRPAGRELPKKPKASGRRRRVGGVGGGSPGGWGGRIERAAGGQCAGAEPAAIMQPDRACRGEGLGCGEQRANRGSYGRWLALRWFAPGEQVVQVVWRVQWEHECGGCSRHRAVLAPGRVGR